MTAVDITAISETFVVRLTNQEVEVSKSDQDQIDRLWSHMLDMKPAGNVFDGTIFSVVQANEHELVCQSVPYRFFCAQRVDPALRQRLNLRVAAVSGITFIDDCVVIGRRSQALTQYPDFFELVPSGSIDTDFVQSDGIIDYRQQLANELAEELVPGPWDGISIRPLTLVFDRQESTFDLCCRIDLPSGTSIPKSTDEYTELLKVRLEDLASFELNQQSKIVPVTTALLRFLSL